MRSFLLFLIAFIALPALAKDERPRFTVAVPVEGKDLVTGRKVVVPPGRGYKFEFWNAGGLRYYMRVYDSDGLEVQAFFPVSDLLENLTMEEMRLLHEKGIELPIRAAKPKVSKDELKEDISSGLQATTQGAVVAKEGCCDVDGKKEEPKVVEADVAEEKPVPVSEPEIESPPEDFADFSLPEEPKVEEEPEIAEETPVQAEPKDVARIESPPEDFVDISPDPKREEEPRKSEIIAEIERRENIPIPKPRPNREEVRGPALERPEAEEYVKLPDVVPIPRPRPRRDEDVLDSASAGRIRKPAPEKVEASPRKPASSSICRAFDAFKKKGVPETPLRQALAFLSKNKSKFGDQRYLSVVDYSQSSSKRRFYLLDMKTLGVTQEKVSHGSGKGNSGDRDHDGMLNACGGSGSDRTRGGFFQVGDYYFSQGGRYKWPMLTKKPPRNGMRLIGLTPGVNSSAQRDGYVMHEAKYNSGGSAKMGRSNGCPAFVPGRGAPIVAKLRGGSLQYHYTPQCKDHYNKATNQVPGWRNFCK